MPTTVIKKNGKKKRKNKVDLFGETSLEYYPNCQYVMIKILVLQVIFPL